MNTNRSRSNVWKIGSFTKNFRWGKEPNGLKRLYDAINVGFAGRLAPVPRHKLRQRLSTKGYIDFIPANFFLFNQRIGADDFIAVDELVYQAIKFDHGPNFDRLALFTLLLSEAGKWRGATSDQQNPPEWARYFVVENLSKHEVWTHELYSADAIERYLSQKSEFEGNMRKLSTNLSYIFNKGNLEDFGNFEESEWFSNAVFLALDRYYMIRKPETPTVGWAVDTLAENDVVELSGPLTEFRMEAQKSLAKLFVAAHGIQRFDDEAQERKSVIAVLNRQPALVKRLPEITREWIEQRLFVEIVDSEQEAAEVSSYDYDALIQEAIERAHNSLPKPKVTGDEIIALFRNQDDID